MRVYITYENFSEGVYFFMSINHIDTVTEKTWYVYKHTSPSNKVYIGITSQKPIYRWRNGLGYNTQQYFWRAIQKYGWENFTHEVLFEGLSIEDAKTKVF